MVHEALAASRLQEGESMDVRFVSNVDPSHLDQAIAGFGSEPEPCWYCVQDLHDPRNHGQCAPRLAWLKGSWENMRVSIWPRSPPMWKVQRNWAFSRRPCFWIWQLGRREVFLWGPVGLAIAFGSGVKAFLRFAPRRQRHGSALSGWKCRAQRALHLGID